MSSTAITIERIPVSKIDSTDLRNPEFGKVATDHMFMAEYRDGEWQNACIRPVDRIPLSPLTLALHYGQSVFEGMKAFRGKNGKLQVFRLEKHYQRLSATLRRMAMAELPFEIFKAGIENIVRIDQDWAPPADAGALYLRPLIFASEARLGVKVSDEYCFLIVALPVGLYFNRPLRLKIEERYIRAAHGGTGFAKCSGNYGASFFPARAAQEEGYDQVIWTDGSAELNIEESGVMNVFFKIDGKLVTPPLSDTILDGVTRDSLLTLAREAGMPVEERTISAFELAAALEAGRVTEAFGTGTAAVVAPIQRIGFRGKNYELPAFDENSSMMQLKKELENIRNGSAEDRFGWMHLV